MSDRLSRPYGPNNPAPGTRLWRLRTHPETLTLEQAVAVAHDLDRLFKRNEDDPSVDHEPTTIE